MATKIVKMWERKPTLEEAQAIVGGYVQLLELPDGSQMLVDEDGIAKEKEVNSVASVMTHGLYRGAILGDVLILSGLACWRD